MAGGSGADVIAVMSGIKNPIIIKRECCCFRGNVVDDLGNGCAEGYQVGRRWTFLGCSMGNSSSIIRIRISSYCANITYLRKCTSKKLKKKKNKI